MVKLSSLNGMPEEPVSHSSATKKRVWFRERDMPPFTQIARVVVPPGEVLAAHAHGDMHELFIILEGTPRMLVDGVPRDLSEGEAIALAPDESHELSNHSDKRLVFLVAVWTILSAA